MSGIRTKNRRHEPRKRPIQARSRATVEVVLEAAAQVFERAGYHETTTDDIAARAGVSIGTLYQYYPNKDALLVGLFERHLAEIEQSFAGLVDQLDAGVPPRVATEATVAHLYGLHRAAPNLHRIFVEDAPLPARLLADYAALEGRLREAWERYLTTRVAEPALVARMILSVVETLAHRHTLYPPPDFDIDTFERATTDMLLAYVQAG